MARRRTGDSRSAWGARALGFIGAYGLSVQLSAALGSALAEEGMETMVEAGRLGKALEETLERENASAAASLVALAGLLSHYLGVVVGSLVEQAASDPGVPSVAFALAGMPACTGLVDAVLESQNPAGKARIEGKDTKHRRIGFRPPEAK